MVWWSTYVVWIDDRHASPHHSVLLASQVCAGGRIYGNVKRSLADPTRGVVLSLRHFDHMRPTKKCARHHYVHAFSRLSFCWWGKSTSLMKDQCAFDRMMNVARIAIITLTFHLFNTDGRILHSVRQPTTRYATKLPSFFPSKKCIISHPTISSRDEHVPEVRRGWWQW